MSNTQSRPVSALLGIGIFIWPLIFAWFTLREGYSTTARVVSFVWAGISFLFGILVFVAMVAAGSAANQEMDKLIEENEAMQRDLMDSQQGSIPPSVPVQPQSGNTSDTMPQTGFGTSPAQVSGAMNVTAAELATAYEGNEVAAQARYGNKTLIVTGIVEKVGLDIMDDPQISLDANDAFRSVTLSFDKSFSGKIGMINKGQTVTAKCNKISEVMSMPMLDDCSM